MIPGQAKPTFLWYEITPALPSGAQLMLFTNYHDRILKMLTGVKGQLNSPLPKSVGAEETFTVNAVYVSPSSSSSQPKRLLSLIYSFEL